MRIKFGWSAALALAGVWAVVATPGCTKRNPDACCETEAECTALGFDSKQVCALGACVQNQCTAAVGACDGDEDCGGATAACVDGTCAVCRDSATCPATDPVCDATSHDCRGCIKDSECDSGACDLAAGTCVNKAEILYAAPQGGPGDPCTSAAPCSLRHAAELVDATHIYIVLTPGSYQGGARFIGKTATIAGSGATIDLVDRAASTISIEASSSIQMRNFHVQEDYKFPPSEPEEAIIIDSSKVSFSNMTSKNAATGTIREISGNVTLTHSVLDGPGSVVVGGGQGGKLTVDECIFLTGGPNITIDTSVQITNSIFITDASEFGLYFFNINPLTSSEIISNTFIGGHIFCPDNDLNYIHFTGNIFYNMQELSRSPSCAYDYNLITPLIDVGGFTNITGDPHFVDPANMDFHLRAGSPALDAADPFSASNTHDFDGTLRPQGGRVDIGAFEYHP